MSEKTKYGFTPQIEGFRIHLERREKINRPLALKFCRQIQDFIKGGMLPTDFFHEVIKTDEAAAESFLMNFRHFTQYQTNQYFGEFHQLRWELGRKHKNGGF